MADSADKSKDAPESLEGGNYDVIHERLVGQGRKLAGKIEALNSRRHEVFGGTELEVVANERIRTEHNCVPRDIHAIQGNVLFGYNVFVGLKKETVVSDVFSLHQFAQTESGYDLGALSRDFGDAFLADQAFEKDFQELYRYYDQTRLLRLRKVGGKLLAVFQTGATTDEVRVFRWKEHPDGKLTYVDSRGDIDDVLPSRYDFEWKPTTRDDQVTGRFPHLSILDLCFVETTGGDLTIKVENNTETGRGIYAEPVVDENQTLDDGEFFYAQLGGLILLKIRPFREEEWRYLVFNTRSQSVQRIDAIGQACRQLPEDHGIIFPGGYYLQTGESKIFDAAHKGLELTQVIKSPNGEDILYVFHRDDEGRYELLPYNVIRKESQAPIQCHGYSVFEDGQMLVFKALSDEPSRVHPMQIWQTPFFSADHAATAPTDGSFLAKVGNAELVRGISEAYSLKRLIELPDPERRTFDELIENAASLMDAYYWLGNDEVGLLEILGEVRRTAELVVDEYEKVLALRSHAASVLAEATASHDELTQKVEASGGHSVDEYMTLLSALRRQRGQLITLKDTRYIDGEVLEAREEQVIEQFDRVSRDCVRFLLGDDAFAPITKELSDCLSAADEVERVAEINPIIERATEVSEGLALISEVVSGLEVDDATSRTSILETISQVFAQLNQLRAALTQKRMALLKVEGGAEFAAQLGLLAQSVTSALSMANTPDRVDEERARLMVQLEELEARFTEFDEFLEEIATKREEIYDAFSAKRQTLVEAQQRRAENLMKAAGRIVDGVERRSRSMKSADELNAYLAADPMVMKLRQLVESLRSLGDSVKADDVEARLKAIRQDSIRGLRDRLELFEDGNLIKLGTHRFSVNEQALDLALVPRDDALAFHMTGTDFYETIDDEDFGKTKEFWSQQLVSEDEDVYRAEFLAATVLFEAESDQGELSLEVLRDAQRSEGGLGKLVSKVAAGRYDEGYEGGVHDADAARILERLLVARESGGLLRYASSARALAWLFWSRLEERGSLARRAASFGRLEKAFGSTQEQLQLGEELGNAVEAFRIEHQLDFSAQDAEVAGHYLTQELAVDSPRFTTSRDAVWLKGEFLSALESAGSRRAFEDDINALVGTPAAQIALARAWMDGFVRRGGDEVARRAHSSTEATALLLSEKLDRHPSDALTTLKVEGLLGQHARIVDQSLVIRLDEFLARLTTFQNERVPAYKEYRRVRHELLTTTRESLRLEEFRPKVMSAFVRNRLVNEVYLPLVGDNLAKQIGAAGNEKRTDLMGLLLLISPPGYGKTTLMEYVANRLGLVFMKVNGPALGHGVHSLDPAEAPNATARQEVEKINLAFEMGNNVMLYLDDIQHTHPELLQKFISLCDAQRRVEGVWKGKTKTYDLRGKKFCVVMAGNPYTESGDRFQIPDMLSNRADVYNLGDVLSGREEQFAMSYLENALSSNRVLAPLSARDQGDVYKIIRMSAGEDVPTSDLSHDYSAAELNEMKAVFERLTKLRDVLLLVNRQYIDSASQEDSFRTEPPFKLQGSYRDMNKLAEKVASAMNEEELERLIDDHYNAESQTLTSGAEQNRLKLSEMRGRLSDEERERWESIKEEYRRQKAMGGAEDDPVTRVTGTLSNLGKELRAAMAESVDALRAKDTKPAVPETQLVSEAQQLQNELLRTLTPRIGELQQALQALREPRVIQLEGAPIAQASGANVDSNVSTMLAEQIRIVEESLVPLAKKANQDLSDSKELHDHIIQLMDLMHRVDNKLRSLHEL
ncbi:MAG: SpoVK/Ycf46/Vps4 family AAA+-type ATPase [Polyangiales bacterium]|jgi:SpoVK/Ycf46/Vps4 family AAA+-type ATPase